MESKDLLNLNILLWNICKVNVTNLETFWKSSHFPFVGFTQMARVCWWVFFSKIIELSDTVRTR